YVAPESVHREVNHRTGYIPQPAIGKFGKRNRRRRGPDHIPEMTKPFELRRPIPTFIPVSLFSSKTLESVFLEHIKVAHLISRKRERPHLDSHLAGGLY